MIISVNYDDTGARFLCDLIRQTLQDKWDAEDAPKPGLDMKGVVIMPHATPRPGDVVY